MLPACGSAASRDQVVRTDLPYTGGGGGRTLPTNATRLGFGFARRVVDRAHAASFRLGFAGDVVDRAYATAFGFGVADAGLAPCVRRGICRYGRDWSEQKRRQRHHG